MRFKTFLEAKAEGSPKQVFEPIKDLTNFLKENCSDSLWMIAKNKPLFRGFRNKAEDAPPSFVDLTKTSRKSQNTSNWYTEIFDNHPEMQDFPKRSKSLVCTTSQNDATGYGEVFAMIPVNGSKIGLVGSSDMWDINVNFFGSKSSLDDPNDFLSFLKDKAYGNGPPSFGILQRLDKDLKDPESQAFKNLSSALIKPDFDIYERYHIRHLKTLIGREDFTKHFLDSLLKSYSPSETGLTVETTATLGITGLERQEVWFDKGAVLICLSDWRELVDDFKNNV